MRRPRGPTAGGAEIELTLLLADIRGSTALAERMSASEFSRLMNRFYDVATHVLIKSDGWIDKLVEDEVIAFYSSLPGGSSGARGARGTGLMRATGQGNSNGPLDPRGHRHSHGHGFERLPRRQLTLKGKSEPVGVRVMTVASA